MSGRLVGWEGQRWDHWPGEWGSGVPEWPWVIQTVGRQSAEDPRRPGWCELVGTFNLVGGRVGCSQRRQEGSGMARNRARAERNWVSQGQRLGRCSMRRRALRVMSGQGKEAPPEGLGGRHRLSQSDAPGPAGQIVGHDLYRQPGSIGREAPRGEMIEPHAVLEIADGILDLGVAAVVGLQFEGVPIPVGDEAVIAVGGEQGQLGAGRGPHPAYDEPHRRGTGLTGEGNVGRPRPRQPRPPSSKVSASSPPRVWPLSGPAGSGAGGR